MRSALHVVAFLAVARAWNLPSIRNLCCRHGRHAARPCRRDLVVVKDNVHQEVVRKGRVRKHFWPAEVDHEIWVQNLWRKVSKGGKRAKKQGVGVVSAVLEGRSAFTASAFRRLSRTLCHV